MGWGLRTGSSASAGRCRPGTGWWTWCRNSRPRSHAPRTFEHLTIVRGRLIVRSGDASADLGPGDALIFRADLPHSYENPGDEEAVAQLVMSYG